MAGTGSQELATESRPARERGIDAADWPVHPELGGADPDWIKVKIGLSELVGLPRFSNATIGPFVAEMFVRKGDPSPLTDSEKDALGKAAHQITMAFVSGVMMQIRGAILRALKPSYTSGQTNLDSVE